MKRSGWIIAVLACAFVGLGWMHLNLRAKYEAEHERHHLKQHLMLQYVKTRTPGVAQEVAAVLSGKLPPAQFRETIHRTESLSFAAIMLDQYDLQEIFLYPVQHLERMADQAEITEQQHPYLQEFLAALTVVQENLPAEISDDFQWDPAALAAIKEARDVFMNSPWP